MTLWNVPTADPRLLDSISDNTNICRHTTNPTNPTFARGDVRVFAECRMRMAAAIATLIIVFSFSFSPATALAQNAAEDRERATVEKFFQVLQRRPRPGTALDRVYGFHVQHGSLDDFIKSLDVDQDAPNAGESQMVLGLLQLQRGRPAVAEEAFAKAEQWMPQDFAASYYRGKSLLAIGQTEKAAEAIQRAIDRGPNRNEAVPIFTELGRIYGRAGQSEKALEVWTELERLFPGDVRVGGQIAATLAEEGNLQEALKRYEQLSKTARKDDDKIGFAVEAAEIQRRLGNAQESTQALENILDRLRPGSWLHSDVRNRIEEGFLKSGDYDALADYYQAKLKQSPDDLELQIRLGQILVSARRLDEAAKTLSAAIKRAPEDAEVRLALIDVLISQGDQRAVAEQFEQLVKNDPDNPDYLFRWGQALLDDNRLPREKRRAAAAKVWQQLADARNDDAVTLAQIADRMRAIDRVDDAIRLYQQAIEVAPTLPQYREYLGEYLYQQDRKEEAIEVWESIASGDRRNRDSLVRLAEVYGTFKEHSRAIQAWRNAAEFDLTFPQGLRFANRLRNQELYSEAIERLDIAQSIAETPDERDQLLRARITTFKQAGTLDQQIAELEKAPPTVDNLRSLALMHVAAGQLNEGAAVIHRALQQEQDNVDLLLVSAEISELQNRYRDAAERFRKLAAVDFRFQTNHLKKVADLQMRMGLVDEAMETCAELIDANPASPESYQFLARHAFRVSRDDQAFTALRRAMNVAPRDNGPRRALAAALAERYRTEEAIELYWQAMRYETKTESKIALVGQLAPLYDRKGEMDDLIRRINEMDRDGNGPDRVDSRTTAQMTATAYEVVKEFGAARKVIDRLLAAQPRDVALLETMVRLCDQDNELALAAEFQERITALSDTPENRFKLAQLKLDAGIIDYKTLLAQRISLGEDPKRLGSMIQSAIRRRDLDTAMALCQEAIRLNPSLWDLKLLYAQLLLHETGSDEDLAESGYPKPHQRAMDLAKELRNLDLPLNTLPPTAKRPSTSRPSTSRSSTSRPAGYYTSPQRWSSSGYNIARAYRVGRYGSGSYYSSSTGYGISAPSSFGHARVLATSIKMVAMAKRYSGDELNRKIDQLIAKTVALPPTEEISDANLIWEHRALESIANYVKSPATTPAAKSKEHQQRTEELNWRLAQLDPKKAGGYLRSMLMTKIRQQINTKDKNRQSAASNESPGNEKSGDPQRIMSNEQAKFVADLYRQALTDQKNKTATVTWSTIADYRTILRYHFEQIGEEDRASEYVINDPPQNASLREIITAMAYFLRLENVPRADALVDRLLPAVRQDKRTNISASSSLSGTAGQLASAGTQGKDFVERHRLVLLDAVLAQAARANAIQNKKRRQTSLSTGTLNTYLRSSTGGYYSHSVQAPLSTELLSQGCVNELMSLMPVSKNSGQPRSVNIPQEVLSHLDRPLADAAPEEKKMRQILAAYAYWWMKRPQVCYERIKEFCEQYPDDVDLRIEQARLAAELSQPQVALEALDQFNPLDSRMLVRKEMAAMNLASQLGNADRAKLAAERLFGLQMDMNTQLALADQMRRLGMPEKAAAVLRRVRRGRSQDERTDLKVAQAFLAANEKQAAAEVAYDVIRKINTGRTRSTNTSHYRQQAVSILKSAERLEPLIEQAKRRLELSPKSSQARMELAELYNAAGQKSEADQLWAEIAKSEPDNPQRMLDQARALYRRNQHREASELYLKAFKKDPSQFNRYSYELTRSAERGNNLEFMYEQLLKFNPESIPGSRIDDLIRVGRNKPYTETKRRFIAHALKNSYVARDFHRYINGIPEKERDKIPAIRDLIVRVICNNDAFVPTSRMWRVSSRSSGGTANGPLPEVCRLLRNDAEARKQFEAAAAHAMEVDTTQPTAKFLLALIDLDNKTKQGQALETIRSLVSTNSMPENASDENNPPQINGGLLWQGGQIIENHDWIDNRSALLVDVYKASANDPSVPLNDMRFSVGARLVDQLLLNDQKTEARKILLRAYAETDHSSENQYNPGYGDYQEIQVYTSIADKLSSSGFPIDALLIYQRLSASADKYAKAKRWGGNMSISDAQQAVEKTRKRVTGHSAIVYLNALQESPADTSRDRAFELLEFPLDQMISASATPGIQLAIESAKATSEGRKAIDDLADELANQAAKHPKDWSIPAMQVVLAIGQESPKLAEFMQALQQSLPTVETLRAATENHQTIVFEKLVDLYVVALAASASDFPPADSVVDELASYLRVVAKTTNKPGLHVAVASLRDQGEESIEQFLDTVQANLSEDELLSKSQIDACMNIAKIAAKNGQINVSARALKLAFANGPRSRNHSVADAFMINQPQSSPNQRDNGVDPMTPDLLRIVKHLSESTGHRIGAVEVDEKKAIDQQTWVELEEALRSIVLPESQPGTAFVYSKRIASRVGYDSYRSDTELVPESLSIALARVSILAGTSDELFSLVRSRLNSAVDKPEIASVLVDVAVAARDADALTQALNEFQKAVDSSLPALDSEEPPANQGGVITQNVQEESFRKSDLIDLMLRTLIPVASSKEIAEMDRDEIAKKLLARTGYLIQSDNYTSSRHRELLRRIEKRGSFPKMAESIAPTGGRSGIGGDVSTLAQRIFGFGRANRVAPALGTKESLLRKLINDGMLVNSTKRLRSWIQGNSRINYESNLVLLVCQKAAALPPQQRYDFLQRLTFGQSDGDAIVHLSRIVSPTTSSTNAAAANHDDQQHGKASELADPPTCTDTVPIANTLLMLADVAAELNKSAEVAKQFRSRSEHPGDEADVAAAIVSLAASTKDQTSWDQIEPTLAAAAKKLASSKPSKSSESIMIPELPFFLATRAIAKNVPETVPKQIIADVATYAELGGFKAFCEVIPD